MIVVYCFVMPVCLLVVSICLVNLNLRYNLLTVREREFNAYPINDALTYDNKVKVKVIVNVKVKVIDLLSLTFTFARNIRFLALLSSGYGVSQTHFLYLDFYVFTCSRDIW